MVEQKAISKGHHHVNSEDALDDVLMIEARFMGVTTVTSPPLGAAPQPII